MNYIDQIVDMYYYIILNKLSPKINSISMDFHKSNNDLYYKLITQEIKKKNYSNIIKISGSITKTNINGVICETAYERDLELLKLFQAKNFNELKSILDTMIFIN